MVPVVFFHLSLRMPSMWTCANRSIRRRSRNAANSWGLPSSCGRLKMENEDFSPLEFWGSQGKSRGRRTIPWWYSYGILWVNLGVCGSSMDCSAINRSWKTPQNKNFRYVSERYFLYQVSNVCSEKQFAEIIFVRALISLCQLCQSALLLLAVPRCANCDWHILHHSPAPWNCSLLQ